MLQRLIHSARVNVFESARFYSWVVLFLITHNIFRTLTVKYYISINQSEVFWSKAVVGITIAVVYFFAFVSSLIKWRELNFFMKISWLILLIIGVSNEIIHFVFKDSIDLFSSVSGQWQTTTTFTLSLLFVTLWSVIARGGNGNKILLNIVERVVVCNALMSITGLIFDLQVFESYPYSGRWGYSGFMFRNTSILLYFIFIIREWQNGKNILKLLLLSFALLISGTKSGIMIFGLLFLLLIIKRPLFRVGGVISSVILMSTINYWVPWLSNKSLFWSQVYNNYGSYGVLFSLRNENFNEFWQIFSNNMSLINILFGGGIRSEVLWIEMLPFDLFCWFGAIGLLVSVCFYLSWIKIWLHSIPLLVSMFSGILVLDPVSMIVLNCLFVEKLQEKDNY